jgi:cytochrome oxidase assembly protein ShyY1
VATAACVRLGFWQLDRYRLKQKLNAERAATLSAAPIPWDGSTTIPDVLGRRLAVSAVTTPPFTSFWRIASAKGRPASRW